MIKFCGWLKSYNELKETDTTNYSKVSISLKEKIISLIVIAIPCVWNFYSMLHSAKFNLYETIIFDVIGLFILIPLFYCHELLHCISYSNEEEKCIYAYQAWLLTYCTEKVNKKQMVKILLFPNIVITLPVVFLSLILTLFLKYKISSIISFLFILVVAGAYSDITMLISILKYSSNDYFCFSKGIFYVNNSGLKWKIKFHIRQLSGTERRQ